MKTQYRTDYTQRIYNQFVLNSQKSTRGMTVGSVTIFSNNEKIFEKYLNCQAENCIPCAWSFIPFDFTGTEVLKRNIKDAVSITIQDAANDADSTFIILPDSDLAELFRAFNQVLEIMLAHRKMTVSDKSFAGNIKINMSLDNEKVLLPEGGVYRNGSELKKLYGELESIFAGLTENSGLDK